MPTTADTSLDHIAAPLRPLAVPVGSLNLDPANARRHDERNLAAPERRRRGLKQTTCADCGSVRIVRCDTSPTRCRRCASRFGGRAPKPARRTGANVQCDRCRAWFWRYRCDSERRFCSPACASAARRAPDKATRVRARELAHQALRAGNLTPSPCELCGERRAQMHHEDYARPLWVRWLCRLCHDRLHRDRGDLKAR